MRNEDLPNLFIIGAPKCGTTSMFYWLSDHPQICRPRTKEPNFFLDRELNYLRVRPNHRLNGIREYLNIFERVNGSTRVKLDGSTHYLYSKPALNFISGISPTPRIIIQLRNPAARIWSHFHYIKQQAIAPIQISFPDYVDILLNNQNKSTVQFTEDPFSQHLLENQLHYSSYLKHLRIWKKQIPKDHFKIFVLEELTKNKRRPVLEIAKWIGVDPSYYDNYEFKTRNAARSGISKNIRSLTGRYAKYFPHSITKPIDHLVDSVFRPSKAKQTQADQCALNNIEAFFAPQIQELQSEFELKLSSWRLPTSTYTLQSVSNGSQPTSPTLGRKMLQH